MQAYKDKTVAFLCLYDMHICSWEYVIALASCAHMNVYYLCERRLLKMVCIESPKEEKSINPSK
jgi:hypothetical protein